MAARECPALSARRWLELRASGVWPSARCSHSATRVAHLLYFIGGGQVVRPAQRAHEEAEWIHYADVPVLDVRRMRWRVAFSSGSPFVARRGHSAVLHERTDRIVIFGGSDEQTMMNDVWSLNNVSSPEWLTWTKVESVGDPPSPRRGHRAVVRDDLMVVIGGYGLGLIHTLHLQRWEWSCVLLAQSPGAEPPSLIALFGSALLGNKLLCFGGHESHSGSMRTSNALSLVDLTPVFEGSGKEGVEWRRVRVQGRCPSARICCECAQAGDSHLIVFGGTSEIGTTMNDTHMLHLTSSHTAQPTAEWSIVRLETDSCSGMPPARNAMTITRVGHTFLVFGGGIFGQKYYSDLWCLHSQIELSLPTPPSFAESHVLPHLASLVGSEELADVYFKLPDASRVPAHRLLLLSGGSAYLSALLSGSFREARESGVLELELPGTGWSRRTLLHLLRFLYTGDLPPEFDDDDPSLIIALLHAANALQIDSLRGFCEAKLAGAVDEDQVIEVLLLADLNGCTALRGLCLQFMQCHFGPLRRCAVGLPPPRDIVELSGYNELSEAQRKDIEEVIAPQADLEPRTAPASTEA
ncbi:MAG: hypothetical protein SGPRY_005884 [Prymnesium sp.]